MGEFSRMIEVDRASAGEASFAFEASDAELEALAARLRVPAVGRLACAGTIRRSVGGRFRLDGAFAALVTRECVVTLEPFEAEVRDGFVVWLTDNPADVIETDEVFVAPDEEEDIEAIHDGMVDVGEIATQYLALALDPHPRRPEASLDDLEYAQPIDDESASTGPFAALDRLRRT